MTLTKNNISELIGKYLFIFDKNLDYTESHKILGISENSLIIEHYGYSVKKGGCLIKRNGIFNKEYMEYYNNSNWDVYIDDNNHGDYALKKYFSDNQKFDFENFKKITEC